MIGIGPFITLPLVVADMGGPQAVLCRVVGAVVALCDGLVWAELSSRLPGSGGTIPRSIILSVIGVALLYIAMNAAMLGALPWREVATTRNVAATVAERAVGAWAGGRVALRTMWTAFASLFALVLANSRVLDAAARDVRYFEIFARVHPRDSFPYVSPVVLGGIYWGIGWVFERLFDPGQLGPAAGA